MLGVEDHGIMTCMLMMNFGTSGQGVGGYGFDVPVKYTPYKDKYSDGSDGDWGRVGTAYGTEFIRRLLLACGVDEWEKLVGRTVFVLRESNKWGAKIVGIRPLPTEPGREFIFDDLNVLIEKEG